MKFSLKKYLYIANDITNELLKKEKQVEDRRVKKLTVTLIIIAIVLVASLLFNIYLATGA